MITYRKATINDVDELARIRSIFLQEVNDVSCENTRIMVETANKRYFEEAIPNESFVAWLALDGDKIIATSGLSFYTKPPSQKCPDGKVAYISNMYTFPDYRGKGIATELFSKILDEAKKRKANKITLNATDAGRPLYTKYSFINSEGEMHLYIG